MVPGAMKAVLTFQRGQPPEKRAKLMPEPLKRLLTLPAVSVLTRWKGTPSMPGRRSVVRRWHTCSKLVRKRWPSSSMSYRSASAASSTAT